MTIPGSGFSLSTVNIELGVSGQSLSKCIALAGKTGTWTKLSDFAGYSTAQFVYSWFPELQYYFKMIDPGVTVSITSSPTGWTVISQPTWITVTPKFGSSGTTSILIRPLKNLNESREGYVRFRQNTTLKTVDFDFFQEGGFM